MAEAADDSNISPRPQPCLFYNISRPISGTHTPRKYTTNNGAPFDSPAQYINTGKRCISPNTRSYSKNCMSHLTSPVPHARFLQYLGRKQTQSKSSTRTVHCQTSGRIFEFISSNSVGVRCNGRCLYCRAETSTRLTLDSQHPGDHARCKKHP